MAGFAYGNAIFSVECIQKVVRFFTFLCQTLLFIFILTESILFLVERFEPTMLEWEEEDQKAWKEMEGERRECSHALLSKLH